MRRAVAPGRVNLIGEYTDIVGGHVLPVAIQLGTLRVHLLEKLNPSETETT